MSIKFDSSNSMSPDAMLESEKQNTQLLQRSNFQLQQGLLAGWGGHNEEFLFTEEDNPIIGHEFLVIKYLDELSTKVTRVTKSVLRTTDLLFLSKLFQKWFNSGGQD